MEREEKMGGELLPADRKVMSVKMGNQPGAKYGEATAIQDKDLEKGKSFLKSKAMSEY